MCICTYICICEYKIHYIYLIQFSGGKVVEFLQMRSYKSHYPKNWLYKTPTYTFTCLHTYIHTYMHNYTQYTACKCMKNFHIQCTLTSASAACCCWASEKLSLFHVVEFLWKAQKFSLQNFHSHFHCIITFSFLSFVMTFIQFCAFSPSSPYRAV